MLLRAKGWTHEGDVEFHDHIEDGPHILGSRDRPEDGTQRNLTRCEKTWAGGWMHTHVRRAMTLDRRLLAWHRGTLQSRSTPLHVSFHAPSRSPSSWQAAADRRHVPDDQFRQTTTSSRRLLWARNILGSRGACHPLPVPSFDSDGQYGSKTSTMQTHSKILGNIV